MGSSNREYMQDDDGNSGPVWGHDVPTTKWLVVTTIVVFFLQFMLTYTVRDIREGRSSPGFNDDGNLLIPVSSQMAMGGLKPSYVEDWFALNANDVIHGQVWRLITYVFLHNRLDPFALALNMVALWYLGSSLERMYGSRRSFGFTWQRPWPADWSSWDFASPWTCRCL